MKIKLALAVALFVATAGSTTVANAAPLNVLVYGDSLMKEASSTIEAKLAASSDVTVQGMAGRAPCDYLKVATRAFNKLVDHTPVHYDLFVIETAGNSSSPCMRTPGGTHYLKIGSADWEAKYESDLDALANLAESKGTTVLFVSPPPIAGAATPRDDVYDNVEPQFLADHPEVRFANGPRLAVSDAGEFTTTLPCLPHETAADGCNDGNITVRAPDDLHFCPSGFDNKIKITGCATYDGGAVRFGRAIAHAITKGS